MYIAVLIFEMTGIGCKRWERRPEGVEVYCIFWQWMNPDKCLVYAKLNFVHPFSFFLSNKLVQATVKF